LNKPHSSPTPNPTHTSSGVSTPAAAQKPITVELSAMVVDGFVQFGPHDQYLAVLQLALDIGDLLFER
jgi:hypothetical protein